MEKQNPQNQPMAVSQSQTSNALMSIILPNETAEFLMTPLGQMLKKSQAMYAVADIYAKSGIVPQTFANKPEACYIALQMADRAELDVMMVMQNMYLVHNNPSFSAKMAIALFNRSGKYSHIYWQYDSDHKGCTAYCYENDDKEKKNPLVGPHITLDMADKNGWGAKWKTMPEQMLRYRSASWLINSVAPEVLMGMSIMEDEEDEEASELNDAPAVENVRPVIQIPSVMSEEKKQEEQPQKKEAAPLKQVQGKTPSKEDLFA